MPLGKLHFFGMEKLICLFTPQSAFIYFLMKVVLSISPNSAFKNSADYNLRRNDPCYD